MDNPYAAPEAELKEPETGELPRSPKVIGIISMLLSIVALLMTIVMMIALLAGLSAVMSEMKATGMDGPLAFISAGLGIFSSLWLLFIGFKLFKYRDDGRRHFKFYIIFQAVSSVITMTYQYFLIPAYSDAVDVLLPGVISTIVILLIMVWLLSILNKPHVKASLT